MKTSCFCCRDPDFLPFSSLATHVLYPRCMDSLRMEMKRVSIMICAAKVKKEASSRMPPGYPAAKHNSEYELF